MEAHHQSIVTESGPETTSKPVHSNSCYPRTNTLRVLSHYLSSACPQTITTHKFAQVNKEDQVSLMKIAPSYCARVTDPSGVCVYTFVRFFAVYLLGIFQIVIFQVQNLRLTPSAAHFICSTSFSFSHIHFLFGCVCRPQTLFSCLFLRTFMCET